MNYDRYRNYSQKDYDNRISDFFMRSQANRVIMPYISGIKDKKILEVGVGYGFYTRYLLENNNQVIGLDANPHLGEHIGIVIVHGYANALKEKFNEKFEYIISLFMTEYLSCDELKEFIEQGIALLDEEGVFLTTVILKKGLGSLYIRLARMKGVKKYNYTMKQLMHMVEQKEKIEVHFMPLNTVLGVPFAVLLEIKKI